MSVKFSFENLKGELHYDYPLAKLNTWRVGGSAECLYVPADKHDLAEFLKQVPENENIIFLGLGSNILIRDNGVKGIIISTRNQLNELEYLDNNIVRAGAGLASAKLAHFCQKHGLAGLEFLAGVPGTVGGALAMNAGAYGGETWKYIDRVEVVNRKGNIIYRAPVDYTVSYRQVDGVIDEWFLSATFTLLPADKDKLKQQIKTMLQQRAASQPTRFASCGSVFRNPQDDYAARLVESCGLKGYSIGGAQVSTKHANFIVNNGTATANDIESLIQHVYDVVRENHGIDLIREIRILGE